MIRAPGPDICSGRNVSTTAVLDAKRGLIIRVVLEVLIFGINRELGVSLNARLPRGSREAQGNAIFRSGWRLVHRSRPY